MNKERLLNVARACRESKVPEDFLMRRYVHECGAPACALGLYASRRDLQTEFCIDGMFVFLTAPGDEIAYLMPCHIQEHFGISGTQCIELFDYNGCGKATTPIQAAEYIERFVRENE